MTDTLDIFLAVQPGLEALLAEEASALGFAPARVTGGGVEITGGWPEVWRANLCLRGASRVLVRVGSFRAQHLSQLDKLSRKLPWGDFLQEDVPVKVEATSSRSKLYHTGAIAERVARASGDPSGQEDAVRIFVRIDRDVCTVSVDTSGELLHRRGFKQAVGKAPLRETQAALFLRACGYDGQETVVDPMCGSGTFPIEAAEWAAGLMPGI